MRLFLYSILFMSATYASVLSVDEAVKMALTNYPDIKSFSYKAAQSREQMTITRADYLPQMGFSAEYDPQKTYVLPKNGVFNTIDQDGWQATLTVTQKIWDFSKTHSALRSAKAQYQRDKMLLEDQKAALALKVKLQYAMILVDQKAVDVRQKDLESKKALYDQSRALVKQGMKTEADASRFLSEFYVAKNSLSIARANFEKSRKSLGFLIGTAVEQETMLNEAVLYQTLPETVSFESIEQKNYALLAAKASIEKSRALKASVDATHFGSLNGLASYSHQETLNAYDATLIGLRYELPLYTGGRISALSQQAGLATLQQEQQLATQKLKLKEQFDALLIDLKRYNDTIAAKKAQLKASENTQKVLEARYKEGLATYVELLDVSALSLDAKLGLLEAYYAKSAIIFTLDYLKGSLS